MSTTASCAPVLMDRLRARADELNELAAEHDAWADGRFPEAAWSLLTDLGITPLTVTAVPAADELAVVRAVAAVDVSLGRLVDGHFNALERLRVQVVDDDPQLAAGDLEQVAAGQLRLGVWGADPGPGEGPPAHLRRVDAGHVVDGVKTFCSGAGGVERVFVLVRADADPGPVRLAYVDVTNAEVDRGWFRGTGMRGSASHRVELAGAPVLWLAAQAGALLQEPWFSRDAVRTAASWAGGADTAVAELVGLLRAKGAGGDLESLAVARAQAAQRTIGHWLDAAAVAADSASADLPTLAVHLRHEVAQAVRSILDESARAAGSRPFAVGGRLERARRDLETYLLQHRLEPLLVKAGRRVLER